MNAFTFAVALPTLLVAHNLADHVVQTDHQAAHKTTSWRAMVGHVAGYTLTSVVFLAALWIALDVQPDWRWALAGLAFSAGTHWFIDLRWPVRRLLSSTRSPAFARSTVIDASAVSDFGFLPLPLHGPYLADQALHWTCLFVTALLIAGGTP